MTDFISFLTEHGATVYLVGGAVRDAIYNRYHGWTTLTKDYDLLVTGVEIDHLEELLKAFGEVHLIGKAFGILNLVCFDGTHYEISIPRIEVSTGPHYRDFKVIPDHTAPVEQDLGRRDSTVNAIAVKIRSLSELHRPPALYQETFDKYNPDIIDPYHGINDIKVKLWRAVGNPYHRFLEDPTRIMRAVRQCACQELILHPDTYQAIKDHDKDLLSTLGHESAVRITTELVKSVINCRTTIFLDYVFQTGIASVFGLNYSRSEIEMIRKIFDHLNSTDNRDPILRMVIFLSFIHATIEGWCERWQLSAVVTYRREWVPWTIRAVKYLPDVSKCIDDPIKLRQIIQKMKYHLEETNGSPKVLFDAYRCLTNIDISDMYEEHKDVISTPRLLKISGGTIMEKTGARGKEIGIVKKHLFDMVTQMIVDNDEKSLISQLDHLNISE